MRITFIYIIVFLCISESTPYCSSKTYDYKFHAKLFLKENAPLPQEATILGHSEILAHCAKNFLESNENTIGEAIAPFYFAHNISLKDILETHSFIAHIANEDKHKKTKRLQSPRFLNQHFTFFKLNPSAEIQKNSIHRTDWQKKLAPGEIKLTGYAAFVVPGSPVKTQRFSHALYQLKEGPSSNHDQVRTRFSKTEILDGVLEHPDHHYSVKALAWITEEGFKDALMQGTVFVEFPDKSIRSFAIHKHNGFIFNKKHVGTTQEQYWFFRPLDTTSTRKKINKKITEFKESIIACDIKNLGYGSFVLLTGTNPKTKQFEVRPVFTGDTGGAFKNNISHVDLFVGLCRSKKEFWDVKKYIPENVSAYFLVKKKSPAKLQSSLKKRRKK